MIGLRAVSSFEVTVFKIKSSFDGHNHYKNIMQPSIFFFGCGYFGVHWNTYISIWTPEEARSEGSFGFTDYLKAVRKNPPFGWGPTFL